MMAASPRRAALADISSPNPLRGSHSDSNVGMLPEALMTPPDEQVIQLRSRRIISSPQKSPRRLTRLDDAGEVFGIGALDTPPKTPKVPSAGTRKRLVLSPPELAGDKKNKMATQSKRQRVQRRRKQPSLGAELRGLSQDQLVDLVEKIVNNHPELDQEVRVNIPPPDLSPLDDCLNYLQRNVFRSFPNTRWGSSRDAFCYRRVRTHLEAFKKTCTDQGKTLVHSEAWRAVIEYVVLAWKYVSDLPDWDNEDHNKSKRQCFKNLAAQCMTAIKKSAFEKEQYREIKNRLESVVELDEEIQPCITQLEKVLDKLP